MSLFRAPLLLFSVIAMIARLSAAAHCDDYLFPEDEERRQSSGVQLTRELSATEYGPIESFKTLHCCGKNYLSLEW